jgi:hypothetical protein
MSEKVRAAVVLFVDSDNGADGPDVANLVRIALHQSGIMRDGLTAKWADGRESHIRIIDTQEVGIAAGNGYLWTGPTAKAWQNRCADV